MSTEHETERIVRTWLQTDEHESAERLLGNVLARLEATPQRRAWGAWRQAFNSGTYRLVAAGLVTLAVAAFAIGLYFSRPGPGPAASQSPLVTHIVTPTASPSPTTIPSPTTGPAPTESSSVPHGRTSWVVFVLQKVDILDPPPPTLWAMRVDGTDAHVIGNPGDVPLAWSKDGTRLLIHGEGLALANVDAAGIGTFVDTGLPSRRDFECDLPSPDGRCYDEAFTFAPDGHRVAFVRQCADPHASCSEIGIADLDTGTTRMYSATLSDFNHVVSWLDWSPTGTTIAFAQATDGELPTTPSWDLKLLDVESGDITRLDVGPLQAISPKWSPDGAQLAFTGFEWQDGDTVDNLYLCQPDGSNVIPVTSDGISRWPEWTQDGRLIYNHGTSDDWWIADVNGRNARLLIDLSVFQQSQSAYRPVAVLFQPVGSPE